MNILLNLAALTATLIWSSCTGPSLDKITEMEWNSKMLQEINPIRLNSKGDTLEVLRVFFTPDTQTFRENQSIIKQYVIESILPYASSPTSVVFLRVSPWSNQANLAERPRDYIRFSGMKDQIAGFDIRNGEIYHESYYFDRNPELHDASPSVRLPIPFN